MDSPSHDTAATAKDMVWWLLLIIGLLGAISRICVFMGNGRQVNVWQAMATLISGGVFATFGTSMVAVVVPNMGQVPTAIAAYFMGVLGMVLLEWLASLNFNGKTGDGDETKN